MSRKRCPYCTSLKTALVIIGTTSTITGEMQVCDECDMSFDEHKVIDGKLQKVKP